MTATITLTDGDQAQFIATMPALAGNGHKVETDGKLVFLEDDSLAVLAELDENEDGHYDGQNLWVGGDDYLVRTARWVAVRPAYGSDRAAISLEDAPATGAILTGDDLSAADLGCEPGTVYDVELLDDEHDVLQSVRVKAS